jgi:tRNA threonylcarbamoyladenosine biosynthesis protein TsaE
MKLRSNSDSDTVDIGRRVGERLKPGDVVCLYGDLGAGKTTMVKGIAAAFSIDERDITSASFTIIAEYHDHVPFYHIDLYRVEAGELAELGLADYLGEESVAVIEWAERAEEEIPDHACRIRILHADESSRDIEVTGMDL